MIRRLAVLAAIAGLSVSLAACHDMPMVAAVHPMAGPIRLTATPVPLNPNAPAQTVLGQFRYAGGLALTSPDTARLHGLSDLRIAPDGLTLHAQGDEGDRFDARLVLDAAGRLTGLTAGHIDRLTGPGGRRLSGKAHTDAEGLAYLANGGRLVSFERDNRILYYPPDGGPTTAAPFPPAAFEANSGVEALTEFPMAGPDAYLAGGEQGGIWLCRLSARCAPLPQLLPLPISFGLSSLAVAPPAGQGEAPPVLAVLQRAWDPILGSRVVVTLLRLDGGPGAPLRPVVLDRLSLASPLTRDNFEGVALVSRPGGVLRLYLISDDNFQSRQRTLLMAFDWTPQTAPPAASPGQG